MKLLIAWDLPIFKLEALDASFEEVGLLCNALDIAPPPIGHWRKLSGRPLNYTKSLRNKALDWSEEWKETFRRVAGQVQVHFGYSCPGAYVDVEIEPLMGSDA